MSEPNWFVKTARIIWLKLKPTYHRLEFRCVTLAEADDLFTYQNEHPDMPDHTKWHIAPEEDHNRGGAFVFIERKIRVVR